MGAWHYYFVPELIPLQLKYADVVHFLVDSKNSACARAYTFYYMQVSV